MNDSDRQFQNGFERYKDSLSGIRTFKGIVLTNERRNTIHDYYDLSCVVETDGEQSATD